MTALSLRRATEADIPFIMETERRPGYDQLIGRYGVDEHLAQLVNPAFAYLVGEDAEQRLLAERTKPEVELGLWRQPIGEEHPKHLVQLGGIKRNEIRILSAPSPTCICTKICCFDNILDELRS